MRKLLLLAVCIMALAGCKSGFNTAPVLNVEDQMVTTKVSMETMERCIVKAGLDLDWQMKKIKPGLIEGTMIRRGHTAVVSIPYSTTKYSIIYKSSSEGLYADADGTIHKIYNTWVHNLDAQINKYLTLEGL